MKKMASRYEFTEEQIEELTKAAKENKEKDVDKRLRTLLMRANGKKLSEIAAATGYSFSGIVKCGYPFSSAERERAIDRVRRSTKLRQSCGG